ncbi:MAG: zf-HC2 domain-containing protein [Bdellovibrionales bacterium]|nr:zf-HC2 domain-containing protein [Bdellovibrionales bacterium]
MNCKEVAELVSQSLDRPLTLRQRLCIRYHLWKCEWCVCYKKQLQHLKECLGQFEQGVCDGSVQPHCALSDQAKARIKKILCERDPSE